MAYGIPKIPNRQIKEEILALISLEIDKQPDFASGSQASYGWELELTAKITLTNRGQTVLPVAIKTQELVVPQSIGGEETTEATPVKSSSLIVARARRGRKHVANNNPQAPGLTPNERSTGTDSAGVGGTGSTRA